MTYQRRPPQKKPTSAYHNIMKYVSLVMVFIYFGFGLYVLLSSPDQIALPKEYKIIIGGLLVFYGFIRFVRAYQEYFKKNRRYEE
ncbi:hypothetical protein FHS90_002444 [Rufibacter quisquiliarum]|uniref:Uncharacterized protein n=1 Tax=Rufibacter quisquiliarum TaxID=1549639 RepID=A0A839GSD3_9BACT|nr:hypothetical protein [Rufibacter quisquiliarum]